MLFRSLHREKFNRNIATCFSFCTWQLQEFLPLLFRALGEEFMSMQCKTTCRKVTQSDTMSRVWKLRIYVDVIDDETFQILWRRLQENTFSKCRFLCRLISVSTVEVLTKQRETHFKRFIFRPSSVSYQKRYVIAIVARIFRVQFLCMLISERNIFQLELTAHFQCNNRNRTQLSRSRTSVAWKRFRFRWNFSAKATKWWWKKWLNNSHLKSSKCFWFLKIIHPYFVLSEDTIEVKTKLKRRKNFDD